MAMPALKTEVLARESGRRIRRNQRALGQEGARAAHRIKQDRVLLTERRPAAAQQDRSRDVLFQRRSAGLLAVAAAVQALA